MSDGGRISRLRWLCRRGMKELDILLARFVDLHEKELDGGAWPEFERLLETEDDLLWDWFQDPAHPGAGDFRVLLEQIRRAPR